jgi:ubiquitin-conjugating enzyme E2 M
MTMFADMAELNLPQNIQIAFPDGKDKMMHFLISMRPDEGLYR